MYYTTDNRLFHHPPARSAPGCLGFGSSLGWLGSVPWNPMALDIDLAQLGTFKESDRCYIMRASARAFLCIASWESLGHGSYPDTSGTPTLASLEYDFRIFHDIVKHIPILLEYIKYKHTFFPIKLNIQHPWHNSEGFAQRAIHHPSRESEAVRRLGLFGGHAMWKFFGLLLLLKQRKTRFYETKVWSDRWPLNFQCSNRSNRSSFGWTMLQQNRPNMDLVT
jgi:hypothetical protein